MVAPCPYCHKPLASQIPKGLTGYHGACRLAYLRREWATASPARRDHMREEAAMLAAQITHQEAL